ncbi:MAG: GNAT family N-acetyltransferase [Gammaproteobacteria bacterium]|nr:GNAT family N-acetyltransferase [Gammaproteobacteria bacterium]
MIDAFKDFSFPLNIYAYLLWRVDSLEALHYGFFKDSLWSPAEAQRYASALLFESIPPGVTGILDVGVGVGTSAKYLAEQGYEVTTISPDEVQVNYATNILKNTTVSLENIDYQNFCRIRKYDLIMFQESSQYIPVNELFGHARDLLKDEGRILIMDEIALDDVGNSSSTVQLRAEYLNHASRAGFVLEKEKDFSALAAPTTSLLAELLGRHRQEIVDELEIDAAKIVQLIRTNMHYFTLYQKHHLAYRLLLFRHRGPRSGFYIRPYQEGDELAINQLFKIVFESDHSDLWWWKFRSRGERSYAMLAFRDRELVAQYTGLSREFVENGEKISGVHICDVMVHPKARSQMKLDGAFASVAKTFLERNVGVGRRFQLAYGFPNRRVLRLAVKLGLYEPVTPMLSWTREELRLHQTGVWRMKLLSPPDLDRLDKLWSKMAKDFKDGIIGVRNSAYMKWRYQDHPQNEYLFLGLANRFLGTVTAVAVVRVLEDRALIVDAICEKKRFCRLVQLVEDYLGRQAVRRIELLLSRGFKYLMNNSGFDYTETEIIIPRYRLMDLYPVQQIEDKLFLMIGDSDLY